MKIYVNLLNNQVQIDVLPSVQSGAIQEHYLACHNIRPSKHELLNNTKILTSAEDKYRLSIKEALLILHCNPSLNKQYDNFTHTLKLKPNRNVNLSLPTDNSTHGINPPDISHISPYNNETDTQQNVIASSNVIINQEPVSPQLNNRNTPHPHINNHFISPNISRRIDNLLNSTRSIQYTHDIPNNNITTLSQQTNQHDPLNTTTNTTNQRSPIVLSPRRHIQYF